MKVSFPEASKIVITCPRGIPPYLAREVASLGFQVEEETALGVETRGTLRDSMVLNLHLRTAHRVLYLLREFDAEGPDELYRAVSAMPWEGLLRTDRYLSVTSSVENPLIRDSRFANQKCKDAIVDRMKTRLGRRPDSGPARDRGAVVHLYWRGSRCAVYVDTSGEPLSKRGYRKIPLAAPMQETLAAAVIMAMDWDETGNFVNPMCGSGTLAIEAALAGLRRSPGTLRGNFGFMHLQGFDSAHWESMRKEAKRAALRKTPFRIIATDRSARAEDAARKNAETAGVWQLIDFKVCDFKETEIPEGGGVVFINPEYGERMGKVGDLEEIYAAIGDFFKQKCDGYKGYIFTGSPALTKKVGLRTKRRMIFFNGPIECRLLEYELYAGSRKASKR